MDNDMRKLSEEPRGTLNPFDKKAIEEGCVRVEKFDINGGIYVETTEDPIGWMLGDKTRKIYRVTIVQIACLTTSSDHRTRDHQTIKHKVMKPSQTTS